MSTKLKCQYKPDPNGLLGGNARFHDLMQRAKRRALATENEAPPIGLAYSEWQEIELYITENLYYPEGNETLEDRFQKEYDQGYKAGRENMREEIKRKLLDIAAEHFKNGKDQEAQRTRDLARTMP